MSDDSPKRGLGDVEGVTIEVEDREPLPTNVGEPRSDDHLSLEKAVRFGSLNAASATVSATVLNA